MAYAYVSVLPLFTILCSYMYFNMKSFIEIFVWNMMVTETIIRKKINGIIKSFIETECNDVKETQYVPIIMVVKHGDILMVINKDIDNKKPLRDHDLLMKLNYNGDMTISDNVDDLNRRNSASDISILSITLKLNNKDYDLTPKPGDPNIFIEGNKIFSHNHMMFLCKQMEIDYIEGDIYQMIIIDSDINVIDYENGYNELSHILVEKDSLIIHNDIKK